MLTLSAGNLLAHDGEVGGNGPFSPATVVDAAQLQCIEPTSNPFPTQAMAMAFADYLRWTKAQGLSRLAAFKVLADPAYAGGIELPSEEMANQFQDYLDWTEQQGLSRFYAFNVTNFD
ncbi:hypothetical protein CKO40_04265 [Halochromatium glycolicum]|uniref:Uncharacterized protein n=1 Tax=Halochromatium glycolicum TaxID=85075 RepID=A0AAJ0X8B8_9GAMM|nr:hypothetical protein [Halochromatium glycolicum]